MSGEPKEFTASCPIPIQDYPNVLLAHGGGGRLMHQLIGRMFVPAFGNSPLEAQHDSALFEELFDRRNGFIGANRPKSAAVLGGDVLGLDLT